MKPEPEKFDDPVLRSVVGTYWQGISEHATHVGLDAWVLMPNYLHGIIVITDRAATVGARHSQQASSSMLEVPADEIPTSAAGPARNALPLQHGPVRRSLGAIVGNFKSVTTRRINRIRQVPGVKVWQRNYYEHAPLRCAVRALHARALHALRATGDRSTGFRGLTPK